MLVTAKERNLKALTMDYLDKQDFEVAGQDEVEGMP